MAKGLSNGGGRMKAEFAGTLQTSFGMMGMVHFSLQISNSFIGDTNRFLEDARGKRVLVIVETQEVTA